VGALAHLVVIAARAEERRSAFVAGARRYSRFALPTVLVILATRVMTAIPEFRSLGEVVSTGSDHRSRSVLRHAQQRGLDHWRDRRLPLEPRSDGVEVA
jgi:hypothetical protein